MTATQQGDLLGGVAPARVKGKVKAAPPPKAKAATNKAAPQTEPAKPKPRTALAIIAPASSAFELIERLRGMGKLDVETLERLIALRDRERAEQRELAFNAALREVQVEMPVVIRDGENKETRSKYAKLETVSAAIGPVAQRHGFTISYGSEVSPLANHYRVTAELAHTEGHKRGYHVDVPIDMTGPKGMPNKTATHGWKSAMTYGQRTLMCMIFNVVIRNQDDDGNAAGTGPVIDEKRLDGLMDLIESVGADRKKFMAFFKIDAMAELPARKYADAVKMLNEFGAQKGAKGSAS